MKFEYKILKVAKDVIIKSKNNPIVNLSNTEEFEKALNELGAEGWDLAQVSGTTGFLGLDSGYVVFKRQVN